jgi:hypothetical protein
LTIVIDDIVTPAELTGYVREVPAPRNLLLERFLPVRLERNIKARITQIKATNRAAKFRNWDTPAPQGRRDSFSSRELRFPPISQKLSVGEQEELELEMARTGGDNRSALVDQIYDDVDTNVSAIWNRFELARGDVFEDGVFTIRENGLVLQADFGLDPLHKVAPVIAWDNHDTATPLSDMRPWIQRYVNSTGERPGYMVVSESTVGHMQMSKEVRQAAAGAGQIPSYVTDETLAQLMRVHRYPQIVPYDCLLDVDDVTTRTIAEGKAIFLPAEPESLGYTAIGITAEALMLTRGANPSLIFAETPGLAGVVTLEGDPPRRHTKVSAVGMPMLTDIRRLMVATTWTP